MDAVPESGPSQSCFFSKLGRRVIYDFDKFGDSPACISSGAPIEGKTGTSQGLGYTEKVELKPNFFKHII